MFDGNAYRKDVLKGLLEHPGQELADPFRVVGLDPSVDDDALIRERLAEVVAFWRKEQSSARYKGLVSLLLAERSSIEARLLDPVRRAAARDAVQAERTAAEQVRFARLDEMLDALERRAGGIPRSRVDRLRAAAAREGVTDAEFDQRLSGRTLIDDQVATVEPPPPAVRRQVAGLLEELNRLDRSEPGARAHRTLHDFLGVGDDATADAVVARREALAARNRQRRHDRLRTVVDELLALSTTLLVDDDPARYRAGLVEDVRDRLRPDVETAVLLEDRVSAFELERLTRSAVSAGIDPSAARALVIDVARDLHAPVEVGHRVDYVVCARCNATNPLTTNDAACTRCGAPLHRDCPRCGRLLEAIALRCPGCDLDVRAHDDAEEDLGRARADLTAGLVAEARRRVAGLAEWAAELPAVHQVADLVDAAHRRADEAWEALTAALDDERFDDAADHLDLLERTAADVTGPGGTSLDDARLRIAEGRAAVDGELAAAAELPAGQREQAYVALLERHPASQAVVAALRSVPVAPPSQVRAVPGDDGVEVTWEPSSAPGPVEYRVTRSVLGGDEHHTDRPVAVTAARRVSDAGLAAGSSATYTVRAVRAGIASEPAGSGTVQYAPEVDHLVAVVHDGAVELTWTRRPGVGDIWIDRHDTGRPDERPRRLRGGERGVLDSSVTAGRSYRYRVFVEYRPAVGPVTATAGREVTATALAVPDLVAPLVVGTAGHRITVGLPEPDVDAGVPVTGRVLRSATAPDRVSGLVDEDRLRRLGAALADDGRVAFDHADGPPRWYVPVLSVGDRAVVGDAVLHPGVGEVSDLRAERRGDDVVVHWSWPTGCTEVLASWRIGAPPVGPDDPAATTTKVTNVVYDIAGGWTVASPPPGDLHLLVLATARVAGVPTPLSGWSERSTGVVAAP